MKYTIILLLSFTTAINLNAQQNKIGMRYGLGWHNTNGKAIEGVVPRLGSVVGINYEIERTNKTYYQFEINYEERGFQTEIITIPFYGTTQAIFDYNYLSFPVKYGVKSRGKSYFTARIGVIPSVLLFAKTYEIIYEEVRITNVSKKVSRFDLGVTLDLEFNHILSDKIGLTYGVLSYQNVTTFTNKNYFEPTLKMKHYGIVPVVGFKYLI